MHIIIPSHRPLLAARRAALTFAMAALVLGGTACSRSSKDAETPTATPTTTASGSTPSPAGTRQPTGTSTLQTDFQPFDVQIPLPFSTLDGITISMDTLGTTLSPVKIDTSVGIPAYSVGPIAKPSYQVDLSLSGPSPSSFGPFGP